MSLPKKLIISLLVALQIFAVVAKPLAVHAQNVGPWYSQDFGQWYTKVYDDTSPPSEIFGERYTAAQVQWVFYGFFSLILNFAMGGNTELGVCLMNLQGGIDINSCYSGFDTIIQALLGIDLPGGARGNNVQYASSWENAVGISKAVFATDRPVSAISYTKDTLSKLKLVPTVQAQQEGYGYSHLEPVREVWRAFRNLSYALMVLIVIVMAFMIMFRVKLSPQTVITVQSALPKIFITLILITFSYAIAGLMVDLMYVVTGILAIITFEAGISNSSSIMEAFNDLTGGPGGGGGVLWWTIRYVMILPFAFIWAFLVGGVIPAIVGVATAAALVTMILVTGSIVAWIILLILIIFAVWIAIKIIWTLLKAFAVTLLLIMFSPVIILLGAIVPAGSLGFSGWLKQLAANLAVFPTVGFMLVLSMWFMGGVFGFGSGAPTEGQLFSPPNLVGGNKAIELMWLGVSFVLFVSTPKAADLIKSMISGQPFNFGTALGEAIMPSKAYTGYALENISTGASPQPLKKLGINVNSRRLDELYGFFHDLGRGQGQWK